MKSHHKLLHFFSNLLVNSSDESDFHTPMLKENTHHPTLRGPTLLVLGLQGCRQSSEDGLIELLCCIYTLFLPVKRFFSYIKSKYSFMPVGFPSAFTENTPPLYFWSDYQQIGSILVNVKLIFPVQFLQVFHM